MSRDRQYLLDMLQSAQLVQQYTQNISKAEFTRDIQLQDSVIRRLLVIAEAARRVSDPMKQHLSQIARNQRNAKPSGS